MIGFFADPHGPELTWEAAGRLFGNLGELLGTTQVIFYYIGLYIYIDAIYVSKIDSGFVGAIW